MGVTLSVQTAIIIVSSIGAVYTVVAVLLGGLTCFFVRETRKRKGKTKSEDRELYAEGNTMSMDDLRCDSAYGTAASGSAPSPSASTDTNTSQGHLTKKTKSELQSSIMPSNIENLDSHIPLNSAPRPLPSSQEAPNIHKSEDDLITKQNTESTLQGGKPVKRTNSYLPSVVMEESDEPFTVLTVHKSTLKRKPKPARTNSQQPLMAGDEREGTSDKEKTGKEINPAALRVIGVESGTSKKPRHSPSPRKKHGHQRPTPKKAARSNSTKPLMAHQDEDDITEEPTQVDWEAAIQGTDSPPNRQSLVLENNDADFEEIEQSINTLHTDLLEMISKL